MAHNELRPAAEAIARLRMHQELRQALDAQQGASQLQAQEQQRASLEGELDSTRSWLSTALGGYSCLRIVGVRVDGCMCREDCGVRVDGCMCHEDCELLTVYSLRHSGWFVLQVREPQWSVSWWLKSRGSRQSSCQHGKCCWMKVCAAHIAS